MNQRLQDVLMCPICIEMLQRPVVMLPCQHNFCRSCLNDMCANPALAHRCPQCQSEISFGPDGVDGLPRNLLVEQLLDEHDKVEKDKIPVYDPPPYSLLRDTPECSLSTSAGTIPSKDLVVTFSKANTGISKRPPVRPPAPKVTTIKKFVTPKPIPYDPQAAKEMEERLAAGFENLQAKIEAVKKLIYSENYEIAGKKCDEVASMAIDLALTEEHSAKAAKDVRDLAVDVGLKDQHIAAISLLFATSKLCERIPDPEVKIRELVLCAEAMPPIARSMHRLEAVAQFKLHGVPVLNDLWKNISRVANAEKSFKVLNSARCLRHIATCYSNIGDLELSLERHQQVLKVLDEHFGANSNRYRIYGVTYHNLATCFRHLGKYREAENGYVMAIESYNKATDWKTEEAKRKSMRMSTSALEEVGRMIDKM